MPIAMAYVPMQQWEEMYKPSTAICEGTAFPGLNKIFCGVRGK
ncbi:MAG: spore coat associated protein CotJA [Lachnospiraceae bacterium]|nr:spore coat associated protein CotJA [Lachnospiraceae bacterium]